MPEPVRDGNAGCAVHGPRRGRTPSVVLFLATARDRPAHPPVTPAPGLRWPRRHRARTPGSDTARSPARPSSGRSPAAATGTAGGPVRRAVADRPPEPAVLVLHGVPVGAAAPLRPRPRPCHDGPPQLPAAVRAHRGSRGSRERAGAVAMRRLCARRDRIQHTQPIVFSQLRLGADPFTGWPDTPPPTRQERTARYAFTRRGRATLSKGTSLCASRVKRFVIERFTPRFLIDIELVGEGVTAGPRDAVDSILEIGDWGHVRHRGETCRSDRPVRTRETRTPRGA
ncbi:hypothetical protein EES46_25330 [Streptomyces sp. ADI98-10]|nr:hypothetical protein EES46_25330 [Streptomyces sp. ADI98-10]